MKNTLLFLFLIAGLGFTMPAADTKPDLNKQTVVQIKGLLVGAKDQLAAQVVKIDALDADNAVITEQLDAAVTNSFKLQKDIQEIGNERDKALWDQQQAEQKQAKAEAKTKAVQANFSTVLKVEHLLVGLMAVFIVALLASVFKPFLTTLWAAGPYGIAGAILIPIVGYGAIFASILAILDKVVKFLPIPA